MRRTVMEAAYDQGIKLVIKLVRRVFPEVSRNLDTWTGICEMSGSEMLGKQAQESIRYKKFHAQGGSVYALYPNVQMKQTVRFIVALQTISDYLDNLCDRAGVESEAAFRQLHLSMLDAIDPTRPIEDYYRYYPYKHDNSYLASLVKDCRQLVKDLPSYGLVAEAIKKYIRLYSDLQTYKHLEDTIREEYLKTWAEYYLNNYPQISCWEFAAAAGSTLGVFTLYAAAQDPGLTAEEVRNIDGAYFPWICGLHILLDYYIDLQEDLQTGDLNFTNYYENLKQCEERIAFFTERSLKSCSGLRYSGFHTTVVQGLLAMYLSDPKALWGLNKLASRNILRSAMPETIRYYKLCRLLRMVGVL
jgi:tetraprenyl-beta-curcumene synthase